MSSNLSIAELAERHGATLGLEIVHLDPERAHPLPTESTAGGPLPLVGHLNVVQPNRIQVFGPTELDWWAERDTADRRSLLRQLISDDLFAIVVTDAQNVPADIADAARRHGIPLLRATSSCEQLVSTLRHFLNHELAPRTTRHGVFIDVLGTGVLLTGDPAVGKSELALELVSRGHSLVADDAPEFSRPAPDTIDGESTPVLKDFLEVRGLGVLNIRSMYGDAAIRHRKRLQLVLHLALLNESLRDQLDRLNGNIGQTEILGLGIPSMTLPVAPGRNLAVLVEAAVRNFLLLRRGYTAADDLMQRQRQALDGDTACD